MKKSITLLFLAFGILLNCACSKEKMKPSDLIYWVNNPENGLVQRQDLSTYFFEAKYKPLDYVIAMEGRSDELSESHYTELKGELSGLQYIDLTIGPLSHEGDVLSSGIQSDEEYFERLDYFVTYANQDIFMVQGKDTLLPRLYHFERNYGLAPKNTLLLGFDQGEKNQDRHFYIDDQILGVGRVKFLFQEKNIQSTPTLIRN